MKRSYLTYQLHDGYIHDWLAVGPCAQPLDAHPEPGETEIAFRRRMLQSFDHVTPEFPHAPNEIDRYECGKDVLFWQIEHCQGDHLLEWAYDAPVYTRLRSWAFVRLAGLGAKTVTFHLTVTSSASVWLNGRHLQYCEYMTDLDDQTAKTFTFSASLKPGNNDLLICLEQVAVRKSALTLALRLDGVPLGAARVLVPSTSTQGPQIIALEQAFSRLYMSKAVYNRDDEITTICPDNLGGSFKIAIRMQTADTSIYGECYHTTEPGAELKSMYAVQLPSGPMWATVMVPPERYYEGLRASRKIPFWVSTWHYITEPVDTPDDWLITTLQTASRRGTLYSQIAKMAVGWWDTVEMDAIRTAMTRVKRREAGCLLDLIGLLGMRLHMAHRQPFPADLLPELDACVQGFDYSIHSADQIDFAREANQILLYASRTLAGQTFPAATFPASGLTGRQERARGQSLALGWLTQHAQRGFALWNSDINETVTALSHLAGLAKNESVRELAAVLLDKILFGLAIGSFQGTFGVSRGEATPTSLRSGRFAPEAPLNYLLWGMGSYNDAWEGVVSLGLAKEGYEVPDIIRAIAWDRPQEMWARERHELPEHGGASLVTYKTPDYVLSSAQDYRPGQRGGREHIWQATLGPDALVFSNHPGSYSESACRRAGWWCGNDTLPRVAQWKDTLIALYNLPEDAWLKFTHTYFPCYAFDEWTRDQGWAFARKGDAYLALYAGRGFELVERGNDAHRELRSTGSQNVWLCQMGRQTLDGSFRQFCERVIATRPAINGLRVEWQTIRGQKLAFDWTGPFLVDGQEQDSSAFKHHESPYASAELPAETMDITYGDQLMRLKFT